MRAATVPLLCHVQRRDTWNPRVRESQVAGRKAGMIFGSKALFEKHKHGKTPKVSVTENGITVTYKDVLRGGVSLT